MEDKQKQIFLQQQKELEERARNYRDIKEGCHLIKAADRLYVLIMRREEYMRQANQLINRWKQEKQQN